MCKLAIFIGIGWIVGGALSAQTPGTPPRAEPRQEPQSQKRNERSRTTPLPAAVPSDDDLRSPQAGVPSMGKPGRMEPAASRSTSENGCGLTDNVLFTTVAPAQSVAQTAKPEPVLDWYISEVPACSVYFTLTLDSEVRPVAERQLSVRAKGMQQLALSDLGVRLEPGLTYRWYVSLVPDSARRSRDLISGALLQYDPKSLAPWNDEFISAFQERALPESDRRFRSLLESAGLGQIGRPLTADRH